MSGISRYQNEKVRGTRRNVSNDIKVKENFCLIPLIHILFIIVLSETDKNIHNIHYNFVYQLSKIIVLSINYPKIRINDWIMHATQLGNLQFCYLEYLTLLMCCGIGNYTHVCGKVVAVKPCAHCGSNTIFLAFHTIPSISIFAQYLWSSFSFVNTGTRANRKVLSSSVCSLFSFRMSSNYCS